MSVTRYPDEAEEIQVWNNAAFDCGESEENSVVKGASWSSVKFMDRSDSSIQSDCSKENQNPNPSSVFFNLVSKQGDVDKSTTTTKNGSDEREEKVSDVRKIDLEIEEIEREINRLSTKLEALRFEKLERSVRSIEKRGRIVAAKFMEPKQSKSKIEENMFPGAKIKVPNNRRGFSLGPAEIFNSVKSRQSILLTSKPEISTQNRRKSCFIKLEGIDEANVTKERGKSLSVSPKSHKIVSKIQAPKQPMTTVGSRRHVKKDDRVLSSVQPRKLFIDGDKSAAAKKPIKPARIVSSRFNQGTGKTAISEARKRSLPDNGNEESNKRRASHEKCDSIRVKKKWEIPSELVPVSVSKIAEVLPKIRTARFVNDSPRDSGPAKRVAEIVGRKSYFVAAAEREGQFVTGQALKFKEGEDGTEQ